MSRDTCRTKRPKRGFKMSAEAIEKRNEARRRNNIAKYGEEYPWFSPDTVEKLRESATGMVPTKRARKNMSNAQIERHYGGTPIRTRAKLAAQSRKQVWTPEQREAASWRMKIIWEKRKKAQAKLESE